MAVWISASGVVELLTHLKHMPVHQSTRGSGAASKLMDFKESRAIGVQSPWDPWSPCPPPPQKTKKKASHSPHLLTHGVYFLFSGRSKESKTPRTLKSLPPPKKKRPPTPTPPHTHGKTSLEINRTLLRFMRDLLNSNLTWPQGGPMPDPFASPDPPPVLWVMHPWGSCGLRGIHTSRGSPKAPWMDPQGSLGVLRDLRRLWRPREAKKTKMLVFPKKARFPKKTQNLSTNQ